MRSTSCVLDSPQSLLDIQIPKHAVEGKEYKKNSDFYIEVIIINFIRAIAVFLSMKQFIPTSFKDIECKNSSAKNKMAKQGAFRSMSIFSNFMKSLKRPPKDIYVGTDAHGNRYFERPAGKCTEVF